MLFEVRHFKLRRLRCVGGVLMLCALVVVVLQKAGRPYRRWVGVAVDHDVVCCLDDDDATLADDAVYRVTTTLTAAASLTKTPSGAREKPLTAKKVSTRRSSLSLRHRSHVDADHRRRPLLTSTLLTMTPSCDEVMTPYHWRQAAAAAAAVGDGQRSSPAGRWMRSVRHTRLSAQRRRPICDGYATSMLTSPSTALTDSLVVRLSIEYHTESSVLNANQFLQPTWTYRQFCG